MHVGLVAVVVGTLRILERLYLRVAKPENCHLALGAKLVKRNQQAGPLGKGDFIALVVTGESRIPPNAGEVSVADVAVAERLRAVQCVADERLVVVIFNAQGLDATQ